jgi:hypothetical protein
VKDVATCSSETSADFQRSTQHYIPEDRNLQRNRYFTSRMYAVLLDLINDVFKESDYSVSIDILTVNNTFEC